MKCMKINLNNYTSISSSISVENQIFFTLSWLFGSIPNRPPLPADPTFHVPPFVFHFLRFTIHSCNTKYAIMFWTRNESKWEIENFTTGAFYSDHVKWKSFQVKWIILWPHKNSNLFSFLKCSPASEVWRWRARKGWCSVSDRIMAWFLGGLDKCGGAIQGYGKITLWNILWRWWRF